MAWGGPHPLSDGGLWIRRLMETVSEFFKTACRVIVAWSPVTLVVRSSLETARPRRFVAAVLRHRSEGGPARADILPGLLQRRPTSGCEPAGAWSGRRVAADPIEGGIRATCSAPVKEALPPLSKQRFQVGNRP